MEDKTTVSSSTYPFVSQDSTTYPAAPSNIKKWMLVLLFFAGAVTAGLIVVSVLGSIYLKDVKTFCPEPQDDANSPQTKTYNVTSVGGETINTFQVNTEAKRVTIKQTTSGKGETSQVVLDYKTNTAAVYDKERNMCYMIAGLDTRLPDSSQIQQVLSTKDNDLSRFMNVRMSYSLQHERPIQDLRVVPGSLRTTCVGRPVYWTLQSDDSTSKSKEQVSQKGVKVCLIWGLFGICIKWG